MLDYSQPLTRPWPHPVKSVHSPTHGTTWNPALWKGRRGNRNEIGLEGTLLTISSTFCHLAFSLLYPAWWNMDFTSLFLCLLSFYFWCYTLGQLFIKGQFFTCLWRYQKNKPWRATGHNDSGMPKFWPSSCPLFFPAS